MAMKVLGAPASSAKFQLTVGPVLYHWSRERLVSFYAQVAESTADTVVLGEVVCARRHEMKTADWLDLARDLRAEGKEVVLATQALIESEADVRTLRKVAEQQDFMVEAGDASALGVLTELRVPFALGPHINVYSREALCEYAQWGARRWAAPVELSLADMKRIHAGCSDIPLEVFAYGRMPLAFSARCFTARHHRLSKDQCEFRCRDDDDGLLLSTTDGKPFLVLNGIQTQSAASQCLIHQRDELRAAGANRLRLSPGARGFMDVVDAFSRVMNDDGDPRAAQQLLESHAPQGGLANGFALARPGIEWSPA
jgi:O2-independent ubiquinone biosynthesis protein UbiV